MEDIAPAELILPGRFIGQGADSNDSIGQQVVGGVWIR